MGQAHDEQAVGITPSATFLGLLHRVRLGDDAAAAMLLREYEPHVRRVVQLGLTDRRLRQRMDSVDVCQSVFADFLFRCRLGQYELHGPEDLLKLLATIARHKMQKRRAANFAARRDVRRTEPGQLERVPVTDEHDSPSQIAMTRELVRLAEERLTSEEQYLIDERRSGRPWAELSQTLRQDTNALRSKLTRAVRRVSRELGLCEFEDHESD